MRLLPDDFGAKKAWLFVILLVLGAIGLQILYEVVWTMFLAVIFAYIFYPVSKRLSEGYLSDRQSAALTTFSAFFLLIALTAPIFVVLFKRRQILIDYISHLPEEFSVAFMDYSVVYTTAQLETMAENWVGAAAVRLAEALPSLSLKAFLFIFLLYAILRYPKSAEKKLLGFLPESSREPLLSYHERINQTVVGIFAIQALTSVLTFIISLPVFYFLGYGPFISLALVAGMLQFIPIVGPALLIGALVLLELTAGFFFKALMILVLGIVVVGFLPDAYLRPKLANRTTGLPASLYFIGFAGGALTIGAVGVIAGPLIIALILETVELLTEE